MSAIESPLQFCLHLLPRLTCSGDKSSSGSGDYVYYSTASSSSTHYPLYRMNMYTKQDMVIDSRAYRFRVDSKYLYVSRKNATGNKVSDGVSRRLYVSQSYTTKDVHFTEVQLPSINDQQVSQTQVVDLLMCSRHLSVSVLCCHGNTRDGCLHTCV